MLCYNVHIEGRSPTQPAPRVDPKGRQPIPPGPRAPAAWAASVIGHAALLAVALLVIRTAIPAAPPAAVAMRMEFAAPPAQAAPDPAPLAAEQPPAAQPPQPEQPAHIAAPAPKPVPAPAPARAPVPVATPTIPKPTRRAPPAPPRHAPAPPAHPVAAQAAAPDATLSRPAATPPASTAPAPEAAPTAPIDGGWMRAIGAWLAAHKTYPDAARQRGEEGRLAVRFTMNRSGQVTAVQVVRGSGSEILDRAALTMLKDARLPPLPEAMPQPTITVTVQIRFALAP
jgi:protein TonB